jgi:hypothetical protein
MPLGAKKVGLPALRLIITGAINTIWNFDLDGTLILTIPETIYNFQWNRSGFVDVLIIGGGAYGGTGNVFGGNHDQKRGGGGGAGGFYEGFNIPVVGTTTAKVGRAGIWGIQVPTSSYIIGIEESNGGGIGGTGQGGPPNDTGLSTVGQSVTKASGGGGGGGNSISRAGGTGTSPTGPVYGNTGYATAFLNPTGASHGGGGGGAGSQGSGQIGGSGKVSVIDGNTYCVGGYGGGPAFNPSAPTNATTYGSGGKGAEPGDSDNAAGRSGFQGIIKIRKTPNTP